MTIAIDFDGTCVMHEFPAVGPTVPGAVEILKRLHAAGHDLILWTMRSTFGGKSPENDKWESGGLVDAIARFNQNGIPLYSFQTNPGQHTWTTSPKCYAQLYIDDAALGCPLIYPGDGKRPYVDWKMVEIYLISEGILPDDDDIIRKMTSELTS